MTVTLNVKVDDKPINTDYFVAGFIDHTVSGLVEALEGTGAVKDLELTIDGEKVTLNLNGALVPTNTFASKLIRSTIMGMLAPLKGVTPDTEKVIIIIHK